MIFYWYSIRFQRAVTSWLQGFQVWTLLSGLMFTINNSQPSRLLPQKSYMFWHYMKKRRENGGNVISFRGGWPLWPATWVGYELGGSALHQCRWAGCCLGAALLWLCLVCCRVWSLTSSFFVNSHLDHSRAWIPACSLTAALLHCCFPSNLSTTTQGAIVKVHGASSDLCTLFNWSV